MKDIHKETKIVLFDRIFYETDIPWVTSSNREAADRLTTHLIAKGFDRIAYLGGTPGTYINTMRFEGYQDALKRHQLALSKEVVQFGGYSVEAGEEMMRALLMVDADIKAVVCVNNLVFLGAMKVVQGHELTTEKPIMMAAFDIRGLCGIFKRPLVCASQDLQKMAQSTVALLIARIQGKTLRKIQITVPIRVEKHRFR